MRRIRQSHRRGSTESTSHALRHPARPLRLRISEDTEGYPFIPGRYGTIEWFNGRSLAVYSDGPRLFTKIWAIPGVRQHQTGDHEMRAIFPAEALEQVALVVRAKRWGSGGRGRVENLGPDPGQTGTSRG